MDRIRELMDLQNEIRVAKQKGDRLVRNFWSIVALIAFACFGWLFFIAKKSAEIDNLPFIVIGIFGVVTIVVLISGDLLFFNKMISRQDDLNQRLSEFAGRVLGLDPKKVVLRQSNNGKQYILNVVLDRSRITSDQIIDEVKTVPLTFRLNTSSLEEAYALLDSHKDRLSRLN